MGWYDSSKTHLFFTVVRIFDILHPPSQKGIHQHLSHESRVVDILSQNVLILLYENPSKTEPKTKSS
jgi:hypothetical protein